MAFLMFERLSNANGDTAMRPTGESFHLAGHNLIYKAWQGKGRPINQGWHVSADELIGIHTRRSHTMNSRGLVVDYHPSASRLIGLIELLDVYAYTYGNDPGKAYWTPIMLRMRTLFHQTYDHELAAGEKDRIISNLADPQTTDDFIEFLYLNGDDKSWNWGKNGMTNAVFIEDPARSYFRKYF